MLRFKSFLLLTGLALTLGPAVGVSQQPSAPPGAPGGPGGRGSRFGPTDPAERWNQMTGGLSVWRRSDITDARQLRRFDFMARMLGVTNGEITREQYLGMASQGFGRRGGNSSSTAAAAAPGQAGPTAPAFPGGYGRRGRSGRGGVNPDALAEYRFREIDTNGDGLLTYDEMDDALRVERDKWDANKDGFIDLNEFKEYVRARVKQYQDSRKDAGGGDSSPLRVVEAVTEKHPTVYRAGKLPPNLPGWFGQLDTDADGQVGLYEWKAAGRPIAEFAKMDLNGDGFLTAEEVLHTVPPPKAAATAANTRGQSPGRRGPDDGGSPRDSGAGGWRGRWGRGDRGAGSGS